LCILLFLILQLLEHDVYGILEVFIILAHLHSIDEYVEIESVYSGSPESQLGISCRLLAFSMVFSVVFDFDIVLFFPFCVMMKSHQIPGKENCHVYVPKGLRVFRIEI
jgi:hypothetical protein